MKKAFSIILALMGVILIASFAAFASTNSLPMLTATDQQIPGVAQGTALASSVESTIADGQQIIQLKSTAKEGTALASTGKVMTTGQQIIQVMKKSTAKEGTALASTTFIVTAGQSISASTGSKKASPAVALKNDTATANITSHEGKVAWANGTTLFDGIKFLVSGATSPSIVVASWKNVRYPTAPVLRL